MSSPKTTKALVLRRAPPDGKKPIYHTAEIEDVTVPPLRKGQVLVRLGAVAFNHRDLWIRKGLYPGIKFGAVLGGDGAGTVVASGDDDQTLLQKRVMLVPMRGWETDPGAPEDDMRILGGGATSPSGTFSEYVVVERDQVIPTPSHLDDTQASTWGIGGVTAWRAVVVNAQVKKDDKVLITGIGGGVALVALQICVAKGARVYVTSGNGDKIRKAVELGAVGGVNYKDDNWPDQLGKLLKETSDGRPPLLDAVIDSGGGPIMQKLARRLKQGGKVVCYGMTATPQITLTMREVMQNQQLIGSTMGSKADLVNSVNFLDAHKLVPIVSHVIAGLENAEEGFEMMKKGEQFGKIVIKLGQRSAKL